MLLSTLGFALMQLTVKFLDRLPATELVLFRSAVSLLLSLQFIWRKRINVWGNNKKFLILRGVFGVTALSLFFFTLQRLPMGSALTMQYLSPIFTTLFGIFLLREKVRHWQWLFFLISFAGIALIKGFDPNITPLLLGLGIVSSIFAGLAYNCIRILRKTDHPVVVVLYFPLVATPIMAIVSAFNWVTPIGWEWLLLVLMGCFTQVGQIYMTKALQSAELNTITSFKYLGVVFALSFDFFIFGTTYQPLALVGIVLVLAGVIINVFYKRQVNRREAREREEGVKVGE